MLYNLQTGTISDGDKSKQEICTKDLSNRNKKQFLWKL